MKKLFILFLVITNITSCKKDWLDAKPDSRLAVLTTLDEFEKLMDNGNMRSANIFSQFGSDEFYMNEANLRFMDAQNIPYFIWAPDGLGKPTDPYWQNSYGNIFTCNTTIEGMDKIQRTSENTQLWNRVYGTALFYRAMHHYHLVQCFAKAYDPNTATTDPGIPIRLKADVAERIGRGTVQQVYDQIIADLLKANELLPVSFEGYKIRGSKHAVYAYLSRMYLSMENYPKSKEYADLALSIKDELLDYNTVTDALALGFNSHSMNQNPEVFFVAICGSTGSIIDPTYARIDSVLYDSYAPNDLRKKLFFRLRETNAYSFKGTYLGFGQSSANFFTAPATDEMYLNRAECLARAGNAAAALADINTLLAKRWVTSTFVPYTTANVSDVLTLVLTERKKELLMRGTRWSDLRRLNKDPQYAVTIKRTYQTTEHVLLPGSNLYTWPLPNDEITVGGLSQNPR